MYGLQIETVNTTEARVKGAIVCAHLEWVRQYFGDRVATRVLSLLPEAAAIEANRATDRAWCSFETLALLDRAITKVCGGRGGQLARELGRYTAHVMLTAGAHSFRKEDLHRFCRCSVVADALLQDRGASSYEEISELHGRIVVAGASTVTPSFCLNVTGYYEQVVTAHGAAEVSVIETACRCVGTRACVFDLSWR